MSPRAGMRYSRRTRPVPWLTIFTMAPRRGPTFWVTAPMYSSGMSITRCSIGSSVRPFASRVMIVGLPTSSSNPSRRIISMRIASWSSPRPETRKVSGESVSSTRTPTLTRFSFRSRPRGGGDALGLADAAVDDAADDEPAHVIVPVEHRDGELEAHRGVEARWRDGGEDRLEERDQRAAGLREVGRRRAGPRVRVEDGELKLVLGRVEVDEEVVHLVEDLGRPRVAAVDLVDDDDGREFGLEGLLQHEPGLGQRPLGGVHEEEHAVHERERPLDLRAEVGVAGRVHDVDVDAPIRDGRVLGHDRDALLALEVDRVHDALGDRLVLAEETRLPEHGVHEGGLAVVDVGDDRDVADRVALLHRLIVPRDGRRPARRGAPRRGK